jgi:hypothetical protein
VIITVGLYIANQLFDTMHTLCTVTEYNNFWEELIAYFPLIRRVSIENDVSNNSYCCMSIRCKGNVFTEPLTSNKTVA